MEWRLRGVAAECTQVAHVATMDQTVRPTRACRVDVAEQTGQTWPTARRNSAAMSPVPPARSTGGDRASPARSRRTSASTTDECRTASGRSSGGTWERPTEHWRTTCSRGGTSRKPKSSACRAQGLHTHAHPEGAGGPATSPSSQKMPNAPPVDARQPRPRPPTRGTAVTVRLRRRRQLHGPPRPGGAPAACSHRHGRHDGAAADPGEQEQRRLRPEHRRRNAERRCPPAKAHRRTSTTAAGAVKTASAMTTVARGFGDDARIAAPVCRRQA